MTGEKEPRIRVINIPVSDAFSIYREIAKLRRHYTELNASADSDDPGIGDALGAFAQAGRNIINDKLDETPLSGAVRVGRQPNFDLVPTYGGDLLGKVSNRRSDTGETMFELTITPPRPHPRRRRTET